MGGYAKYDSAVGGPVIDLVATVGKLVRGDISYEKAAYDLALKGYGVPMTKWLRNAVRQVEEDGTAKDIMLGSPLVFDNNDTRGMLKNFMGDDFNDDEPWRDINIGE